MAIVENHQLVSESLAALLDDEDDLEVVALAMSLADAAALPAGPRPDVVVMDYHLDGGTGQQAAMVIRGRFPDTRIVFLSRDDSEAAQLGAVEAGASAFVHKSRPGSEVIAAIRQVARGASLITPTTVARLVTHGKDRQHLRDSLSPRELEVLKLMAEGVSTREMGQKLGISYSTVRTHVRSISAKLGTRSMINSVVAARELELIG